MIDSREAIRSLDIYSDDLVSLGLLFRASTLQNNPDDEEISEILEGLKAAIDEKQKEAMVLAYEIVAGTDRKRTDPADVLAVNAAIQRCVLAANQANEALKPPPKPYLEVMADINRAWLAPQTAANEAKGAKAKEADPVPPGTVGDTAVASPEAAAGPSSS